MYVNEIYVAIKEDRVRVLMGDIKMLHSHADTSLSIYGQLPHSDSVQLFHTWAFLQ